MVLVERGVFGLGDVVSRWLADPQVLRTSESPIEDVVCPPGLPGGRRRRLGWAVMGAGFTRALIDPQFADMSDEELELFEAMMGRLFHCADVANKVRGFAVLAL